jgi:hypothetical protein
MSDDVEIVLTGDLALVLLALVGRINEGEEAITFQDQAEQRALWDLESLLESVVPGVVAGDFAVALQEARERLRDDL